MLNRQGWNFFPLGCWGISGEGRQDRVSFWGGTRRSIEVRFADFRTPTVSGFLAIHAFDRMKRSPGDIQFVKIMPSR